MKYYVYILETIDNKLYCGIAKNILKRFEEHLDTNKNSKGAKFTKAHKPTKIVYANEFNSKSEAMKEEYRIKKTLSRNEKLDLIKQNFSYTEKILTSLTTSTD